MKVSRLTAAVAVPIFGLFPFGCAMSSVDFSQIERPVRSPELDAYNAFVGTWDWKAEVLNGDDANRMWTGTAEWRWGLDDRTLHGQLSAKSTDAEFDAYGVWSWHPKKKKYIWWMFNNWGYPQEGTAKYQEECEGALGCWRMKYKSVGLDGTTSYGRYDLKVLDNNTITWFMVEWADALHLVKKIEMDGKYTRRQ